MIDFELTDEQRALIETAQKFTRDRIIPIAAECDRDEKFPDDVFKAAGAVIVTTALAPLVGTLMVSASKP